MRSPLDFRRASGMLLSILRPAQYAAERTPESNRQADAPEQAQETELGAAALFEPAERAERPGGR